MNRKNNEAVYVTQPFLPPLGEFIPYLEDIWDRKWLTNNAHYHREFEKALCGYLGVKYISLFSSGTQALVTALQVLRITGEVITTPYSFVASTHSLWWNGIKPVFIDIEPHSLNINPEKIEAAITSQTSAILPVHVYGNPCAVERIQEIADTYGLPVIYDAAHAFGVQYMGQSILNWGELAVLSFHATKVFNTFEGGAIVCRDEKTKKRIDYLKNFGFAGETTIVAPGINAKMNELQAAFGLLQLKYIDRAIERRRQITERYRENLKDVPGLSFFRDRENVKHNYCYFPVMIDPDFYGKNRDEIYENLKLQNIFTRRYFYPLISTFPPYKELPSSAEGNLPVAHRAAGQVLCLPIYPDLRDEDVADVCEIIKNNSK
jgi:dTDP-4-amino-4,6-dideoxygalactose transaminase